MTFSIAGPKIGKPIFIDLQNAAVAAAMNIFHQDTKIYVIACSFH